MAKVAASRGNPILIFASLREPTCQDVTRILANPPFRGWPQDEEEMLGFFKLLLESLLIDDQSASLN